MTTDAASLPPQWKKGLGQGNLALAQINVTPGNLAGNAAKIMRALRAAEQQAVDVVIFPELALMGYPPRDVIVRYPFLVAENLKWLTHIAAKTNQTWAMIGFVEPRYPQAPEKRTGKGAFNAVAVLGEGKIQAIIRKSLLPGDNEFEDYRQFEASSLSGASGAEWLTHCEPNPPAFNNNGLIQIHGRSYGVSICEDLWNDGDFFDNPLYARNPIAELAAQQPDVLINISASPTRSHKEPIRHSLCAYVAQKYQTPLVYVNQVGSVDEVSFDGASRAYNAQGNLFARAKAFEEQLLIINPLHSQGTIEPLPVGQEKEQALTTTPQSFNAYDTSDLGRTYQTLLQGIRDYFEKTGFQKAVLGLSGGLDSSVVVVLLADALGPNNVLAVSMPSGITPAENKSDAQTIADQLGIALVEIPIAAITEAFGQGLAQVRATLESQWGPTDPRSNALDNVQAISRATILRQLGNEFRALPIATSDKSEFYLGYATINGDMSGALAPIGDLPKTKVRALAHWLNENRPAHVKTPRHDVLPDWVIRKPSGADLKQDPITGKLVTAEDELMPYEFADEIIWRIEARHQSYQDMLNEDFQYEQTHPLDAATKQEWLRKFFDRMPKAVFKWFVAPPILMVEGNGSIAKSDYHHPIVANRIQWQGHTEAEIEAILNLQ
ncbi:NAD(+) synthase [Vampirovibrio sp.]|uniref:NAD(+) synthase n=1 Tax=Vampirovibrio sp. TaxID=2717857 RepID=UPI003593E9FA